MRVRRVRRRARRGNKKQYEEYRERARGMVVRKVEEFNRAYGFEIGKISIRNQSSRWGSCSKKGNLSFNYKIALIPERLADYIVVHEICHIGEFNHSKNFWALVAKTIPDFHERKKELRKIVIQ